MIIVAIALFVFGSLLRAGLWQCRFGGSNHVARYRFAATDNSLKSVVQLSPNTVVAAEVKMMEAPAPPRPPSQPRQPSQPSSKPVLFDDERDWAGTRIDVLKARFVHSELILGSIIFLKLLTLSLNGVYCQTVEGSESDGTRTASVSRLVTDRSTLCYTGSHLPAAIVAWIVIFMFGVGFPVACIVILYRGLHSNKTLPSNAVNAVTAVNVESARLSAKRSDYYGFMFRGVQQRYWFYRLLSFVNGWGFALQSVLSASFIVQTFVPGLFFLINTAIVAWLFPFTTQLSNLISMIVGFGGVIQVMIFLGLLGASQPDSSRDPSASAWQFLYWLGALSCTLIIAIFVVRIQRNRKREARQLTVSKVAPAASVTGAVTAVHPTIVAVEMIAPPRNSSTAVVAIPASEPSAPTGNAVDGAAPLVLTSADTTPAAAPPPRMPASTTRHVWS